MIITPFHKCQCTRTVDSTTVHSTTFHSTTVSEHYSPTPLQFTPMYTVQHVHQKFVSLCIAVCESLSQHPFTSVSVQEQLALQSTALQSSMSIKSLWASALLYVNHYHNIPSHWPMKPSCILHGGFCYTDLELSEFLGPPEFGQSCRRHAVHAPRLNSLFIAFLIYRPLHQLLIWMARWIEMLANQPFISRRPTVKPPA